MKIYFLTFLLLFGALPVTAQTTQQNTEENEEEEEEAPENTEDELNKKRRWEASLPGGRYAVNLGNITSISEHSYVLDGVAIITEVTIDTVGASLARFYYMEPVTENSKMDIVNRLRNRTTGLKNKAKERVGISFEDMAQKQYPHSTHAKTVEFRLLSRGELRALYGSLYTAWDTGKGRTFKVR